MEKIDYDSIFIKYPSPDRENLIPLLQDFQTELGYISEEVVVKVGKFLNLPTSKIYGLASFYDDFCFEPTGKFVFKICNGSACHILESDTLIKHLEKNLNIKIGETSRDGMFTLKLTDCFGACALAPIICVNEEYYTQVNIRTIDEIISKCKSN